MERHRSNNVALTALNTTGTDEQAVPCSIHLLGGFNVMIGGHAVPDHAWRLRKAKLLVQALALSPQHALHREQLMELLWPDLPPDAAAGNLYQALHCSRRALQRTSPDRHRHAGARTARYIVVRQQVVRLAPPGPLWIDVDAFERATAQARQDPSLAAVDRALALYTGDLLPENPYDDLFTESRLRLKHAAQSLLLMKATLLENEGMAAEALATYRRILDDDVAHEQALEGLLRLCAALGARDVASRHYLNYVEHVQAELGLEPDAELRKRFEAVAQVTAPSQPAVESPRLPPQKPAMLAAFPFVGRDHALQTLTAALGDHDTSQMFIITGEAGIGKSRLIREFGKQAEALGIPLLAGYGLGDGETPAYGPWLQILHAYEAHTARDPTSLPAPFGNGGQATSIQEAASAVAAYLASGPPVVVVLEDLHWCDPLSLAMLLHGWHRLRQGPVKLLLSCRVPDISQNDQLGRLAQELVRAGAECLELERLTPHDVETLAAAVGRRACAQDIFERSGGNPFFACHLLTARNETLPWTIRQAVSERLAMLGHDTLAVLRIAAVLGGTFAADDVRATADRLTKLQPNHPEELNVESALREACAQGIIHPSCRGYRFDHDLLRQALVEALPWEERVHLHRCAAEIVDDPDVAAHHLAEAGDPAAVPLLAAAGRRAMQFGALTQAYRCFEQALALAPAGDPLRAELLLLLAVRIDAEEALAQQERLEAAISEAERHGDRIVLGLARQMLAQLLFARNDERSIAIYHQAIEDLTAMQDEERLHCLQALIDRRILLYPGMLTLSYALLHRQKIDDPVEAVETIFARRKSNIRSFEDRWTSAFAHLVGGDAMRSIALLEETGEAAMAERSYPAAAWCFAVAANLRYWQFGTDRVGIETVVKQLQAAVDRSHDRDKAGVVAVDALMMPYWYWYGQWDKVRRTYEAFTESGGGVNNQSVALFSYTYGADVLREQGDPYAALSVFAALLPPDGPDSKPRFNHHLLQMAYITLAVRSMIAAGEAEMAQAWLRTHDAWHRGPRPNPITHAWALIQWAELHRMRGNLTAMRQAASAALATTETVPSTWVMLNAHRLLGAAGGPGAADHCARAVELAERCGFPFEIARARLERGRPDDLELARAVFESLNARPSLQRLAERISAS